MIHERTDGRSQILPECLSMRTFSISMVNIPYPLRTPVHPLWRYQEWGFGAASGCSPSARWAIASFYSDDRLAFPTGGPGAA